MKNHIEAFLTDCRAAGLSPRTIGWYEWNLGVFCKFAGSRPVDATLCREFIASLRSRTERYVDHPYSPRKSGGLSPYTIRGYVRTLRRFFHWMVDDERLVVDPSARLAVPKMPKRVPRGITAADFRRLLAVANVRDRAVLLILADCGVRVSELCGIRISGISLKEFAIRVIGKGNQERFVFLSAPTCEAIKKWLKIRPKTDLDFLFIGQTGEQFKRGTVTEILRRLKKRTGITGRCNPHSFRHAFAREYLLSDGDLASLSALLGHSDLETTMIYSTFAKKELRDKHARHSPISALVRA